MLKYSAYIHQYFISIVSLASLLIRGYSSICLIDLGAIHVIDFISEVAELPFVSWQKGCIKINSGIDIAIKQHARTIHKAFVIESHNKLRSVLLPEIDCLKNDPCTITAHTAVYGLFPSQNYHLLPHLLSLPHLCFSNLLPPFPTSPPFFQKKKEDPLVSFSLLMY